ncbi:MAG: hypothetical protein WCO55_06055 [Candidatus Falkowbacteria bacterium]
MALRQTRSLPEDRLCQPWQFDEIFTVINPQRCEYTALTIALNDIQPTESFLIKDWVDEYLKNPDLLFSPTEPIILMKSRDPRFSYFTRSGDHQLYALCRAGVEQVTIAPFNQLLAELLVYPDNQLNLAKETYDEGIISLEDFANRLVNEEEYYRLMTLRYLNN